MGEKVDTGQRGRGGYELGIGLFPGVRADDRILFGGRASYSTPSPGISRPI